MRRPEMVIFDAGRTLIDYVSVNTLRGVRALMPYLTENPQQLSAEQIDAYTNRVFEQFEACRKQLFEVHEQTILKLVYDTLGLRFSISLEEIERIIWTEDAVVQTVEQARQTLDRLRDMGIRTAVISNLDFSGSLLRAKLDALFPGNGFEFVIASSDYGIRKPSRLLFEAGIARCGLPPEKIWYVGDRVNVDVAGSRACGMVPVFYKSKRGTYPEILEDVIVLEELGELPIILSSCSGSPSC